MYSIQPLQDLNDLIIFRCSHVLPDEETILSSCAPCNPWSLAGANSRKGLVAAKERKKVQIVVC